MEIIKSNRFIRFKLHSDGENALIQDKIESLNNIGEFDLSNFFIRLENYLFDVTEYLFDGERQKDKMLVKTEWVRTHAKQQYAEFKYNEKRGEENQRGNHRQGGDQRRVQHTLAEYKVAERIDEAYNDVVDVYEKLQDNTTRDLHERARKAQTALLLSRLRAKGALPLLVSLVENTTDKKEKGNLSLHLKQDGKTLLDLLEQGLQEYLPEQSTGFPIAKASFNFYTINKRPIDYTHKINEINRRLRVNFDECRQWFGNCQNVDMNMNRLWNEIRMDIESRTKNKELLLGEMPMKAPEEYANLRQILKNILAEQKAKFSELIQSGDSYSDLRERELYLFDSISREEFDEYFDFSEKIEEIATKRNQTRDRERQKTLKTQLQRLKKDRGNLISEACRETRNKFSAYKKFSAFYREVAKRHGRLYAQLKGIEKERNESQMITYWAMILQNGNKHKLVLIPKEKAIDCKRHLKESEDKESKLKLFWFESFSFRSLQKLCFSNIENDANKFYSDLKREKGICYKYSFDGKFLSGEFEFRGDEQKKIEFYKDVLRSQTARKMLSIPETELNEEVLDIDFDCLDDFKIALERVCYKRMFTVNKYVIDALKSEFDAQIFDITSLDLRHEDNCKGKEIMFDYTDKAHTKIWREFWSMENENNCFEIRLCPEIVLMYRKPKQSRIEKYGENSTQRNRYLHEQLTLVARFSENSNSPGRELSFLAEEDEKKIVEDFNRKIRQEDIRFALGIDNGEVELSTLGVYLPEFAKGSNEEIMKQLRNVEKFGFPTLTITDLNYREKDVKGIDRKVVQNPSYFLKEDLYCRTFGKSKEEYEAMFTKLFEKKNLLTLDLSTSKVVNGHIVTNGDVGSLFKLWMRHAQRNIYDMNEHQQVEGSVRIKLKRSNDLSDIERRKFIDYLNIGNKRYEQLEEKQKPLYVEWIYEAWNGEETVNTTFEKVYRNCKRRGNFAEMVLCAVSCNGEEVERVVDIFDVRNVFKFRRDFYCLMSEEQMIEELNGYNKRVISNEELDLNLKHTKSSLVANVIGVIDFLYASYKERFGREGVIVHEGFGIGKVEQDLEKFSGNIYRLLERKLYQKFQSKGLVPPIKNLLAFREKEQNNNTFLQIGNICFVDPTETSQQCPVCEKGKLGHSKVCLEHCGFDSHGIMHSNDGIAGYNIAKRGYKEFLKSKQR